VQRHKKGQKTFDALLSEKIIEISRLYSHGVEVFGDKSSFDLWLESPLVALGCHTPKSFLDSSPGIQFIQDEPSRTQHGVLA
jgi:putative toxin-antitoxin system antitoxin component (TIGR02293 family)